ncbi:MAG: hypothetical protein CMO74_15585 [Verrucomicrobiales bacterium]|nr:hypothetical protein [Verrucomicrobiales bacterium]|tara:strand:- start:25454 stop:26974 length:1521 start_codon:yes stop_codon:yes gene_type:complete
MEVGRVLSITLVAVHATSLFAADPKGEPAANAEVQFRMGAGHFHSGNHSEAVRWLQRAANANHTRAQGLLGLCYHAGRGVPQDFDKAAGYLARAAIKNDPIAQFSLARLYSTGQGVPKNLGKALELYRKAAMQGHAAAQANLGAMLENGTGTPRDLTAAAKWYAKSAAQGLAIAQLNLGRLYAAGRGVPASPNLAAKWYEAAAQQGMGEAQFLLGTALYLGEGVPQNFPQAYKWLNLAATRDIDAARQHRQTIADKLNPTQLAHAQRETAQFVARRQAVTRGRNDSLPNEPNGKLTAPSTGTGFFITPSGHLLTNHHVVAGAQKIEVRIGNERLPAQMLKGDIVNDLALLKVEGRFVPLPLGDSRITRAGQQVFTIGFPNTTVQGVKPKYTNGRINSRTGLQDDARQFQIDVPVQPGNSGGALIDETTGNALGIITCRLDDIRALDLTGSLPQNVNYALKAEVIQTFLNGTPTVAAQLAPPSPIKREAGAIHQTAEAASVLIHVQR